MNWQAIYTALDAEQVATWQEYELGSERCIRFEVAITKWTQTVGCAIVKVRLERVKPAGEYTPAGYIGSATFALKDGKAGYERARVFALVDAYNTRAASEQDDDDDDNTVDPDGIICPTCGEASQDCVCGTGWNDDE